MSWAVGGQRFAGYKPFVTVKIKVKAKMNEVSRGRLDTNHLKAILNGNALVNNTWGLEELYAVKEEMESRSP